MARHRKILALVLLVSWGCGENGPQMSRNDLSQIGAATRASAPAPPGAEPPQAEPAQGDKAADPPPGVPRKIIYNADLSLIVENFEKAELTLKQLVQTHRGYLATMDVGGSPGAHRRGTWKLRVPIERFDSFVADVAKLGELERQTTNSQDVTDEFYDLEARIKNKKVEETRLQKHLEDSTGKLSEILLVEKELSRVREEVERMEGRRRLLENLTSLTTVTLTINERINYVPEQAPTFATKVARTFQGSVDGVVAFGEAIVLFAVGIAPWLPILIIAAVVLLFIIRRVIRQYRRAAPQAI